MELLRVKRRWLILGFYDETDVNDVKHMDHDSSSYDYA